MKFIDLFAGIGGMRVGMERAGHKCVGFCEYDKYATASYISMHLITDEQRQKLVNMSLPQRQKEIMKDEYRNDEWYANDIRGLRGGDMPYADCWCFGSPCQDFSITGNRTGLGGDKSSLIREVFRLLGEVGEENKPEWLIYENVKGMLSSNRGFDFALILAELDELGYDAEWQMFNSRDWGVPHHRERIYSIGHLRRKGRSQILPIHGNERKNEGPIGDLRFVDLTLSRPLITDIARCLKRRYDAGVTKYGRATNSGVINLKDKTIRRLTTREQFRLQGFPDDLYEKAKFVNTDTQLYRQAGNAVTTNVVEAIAKAMKEKENERAYS